MEDQQVEVKNALSEGYDGSGPFVEASYVSTSLEGEDDILMATLWRPRKYGPKLSQSHWLTVQIGDASVDRSATRETALTADAAIAFGKYLVKLGTDAKGLDKS